MDFDLNPEQRAIRETFARFCDERIAPQAAALDAAHTFPRALFGELAALGQYCREQIDQLAHGSLPIVGAAWDDPSRLVELDGFTRATLWSHVAARASRAQGRALLDVAARSFGHQALVDARAQLSRQQLDGHLAPVFGFVTRTLGVERREVAGAGHATSSVACMPADPALRQILSRLERATVVGRPRPFPGRSDTPFTPPA